MIFIFNGPPGSGKDIACEFMSKEMGFVHKEFKEKLIEVTASYFNIPSELLLEWNRDRKQKELLRPELGARSPRGAMIYVSEEKIKPEHGKSYFGDLTAHHMSKDINYCFSDGGFVDEVLSVINKVGHEKVCIIQMYRENCSFVGDSRNYLIGSPVECEFVLSKIQTLDCQKHLNVPVTTYRIYNNGSIKDLYGTIEQIFRRQQTKNCIHTKSV